MSVSIITVPAKRSFLIDYYQSSFGGYFDVQALFSSIRALMPTKSKY